MARYIRQRAIASLPVVLGVSVLVFLMLHLVPGDPVLLLMGEHSAVDPAALARLRQTLGLNDPLPVQYGRFLWRALHADLGRSIRLNLPVTELVAQALKATASLALAAMAIALGGGLLLGVLAAVHHGRFVDTLAMFLGLIGVSMPSFWLGFLLILLFSVWLGWLPAIGQGGLNRLVLPALALSFAPLAVLARLVRSSMLEVYRQPYIVTARAKGLAERIVVYHHALTNALVPVVTLVGLEFGRLLAGAFVVETVFSRIGLGRLAITGILNKDFPVVQGVVLFVAMVYVGINLLVDVSYALLDPRVRYG
jgi:ABC-type dipeptide/oligopeptide/nickel transport system permease component